MDLQSAVVLNKAELSELVHEEIDPGPGRPHLCRQNLLINRGYDGFQLRVLAEIGLADMAAFDRCCRKGILEAFPGNIDSKEGPNTQYQFKILPVLIRL